MKKLKKTQHPSSSASGQSLVANGFSLIETITVLAIMILLSVIAFLNFQPGRNSNDLKNTAQQISATLREAQSQAMQQSGNTAWGVYFSNPSGSKPFFALISSNTYSTATTAGYYLLPSSVAYITSTLASGATLTISFAPISGLSSASTSIGLYLISKSSLSSTISIASSGAVSFKKNLASRIWNLVGEEKYSESRN